MLNSHRKYLFICSFILFSFLITFSANSQRVAKFFKGEVDTAYIEDYTKDLTTRLYASVKYSSFTMRDNHLKENLDYRPNNKLLLGLGFNHGIIGINAGFNFPFVNHDNDKYGTTKYLDLTTRILGRQFTIDFYLQKFQGFYLANSTEMISGWTAEDSYYKRQDIRTNNIGINLQYFLNGNKFSYKASFTQNELQKKSAGSFILGGEIYSEKTRGDSSLIPGNIKYPSFFGGMQFHRIDILSFGPVAGYAHTFVYKSRWFFSASLDGSIALGYDKLFSDVSTMEKKSGWTWNFDATLRLGLGYNSRTIYVGISYVNLTLFNQTAYEHGQLTFNTGNFRFNIIKRFHLKKPVRILNPDMWGKKGRS
jgi:hypothetical protein